MAKRVRVDGVRAEDVADAVGPTSTERGRRYARDGAVLFAEWDEGTLELRALVRGGGGHVHTSTATRSCSRVCGAGSAR